MRTRPRLLPIFPAQHLSCLFSLRNFRSSARSTVVRPSLRRPSSRSAWAIQLRIVCSLGSNSRGQLTGSAPGSMKLDYLLAKLGWISSSCSWHRILHSPKGLGVHETGGTPGIFCGAGHVPADNRVQLRPWSQVTKRSPGQNRKLSPGYKAQWTWETPPGYRILSARRQASGGQMLR